MTSKNCHFIDNLSKQQIGFIGAGNMAQAIIHGLIKAGLAPNNIHCSNPSAAKLEQLTSQYPKLNTSQDNSLIASASDILVIAVKPQKMQSALDSIKQLKLSDKLIISVAAGVETDAIANLLEQAVPVVRAMPNTPATIGQGATGLFANSQVSDQQKSFASAIFDAVGISVWIDSEAQMDLVTAISGSGPAHYFLFLEAVIQSAIAQGMEATIAKTLALQTALGAAKMVEHNPETDIAKLRNNVTSPGGTTAAAIDSFQSDAFIEIIDKALKASVKRGVELAEISKQTNK